MRGNITQRGKNSWRIQVYTGKGVDGRYHRHTETIQGRKSDAQRRLTELLSSIDRGAYSPPGKLTMAQHFRNWLDGYVKTNCSERTLDGYQAIIETHLVPDLGQYQLKQLTPQIIQRYYARACDKLSPLTVYHHHRVLSQSLKFAVRQGYIARNPCELVDPPSPRRKVMRTLDPVEVIALLDAAEGSHYYPIIYTALSSGLRQAELLGLMWRDIDLGIDPSISVSRVLYKRKGICEFREPKTEHSSRLVAMTPSLAEFLRVYKQERKSLYSDLGKTINLDDLVFAGIEGDPFDPGVLSHSFQRIAKKAGLQSVRFHDLRHSFASLALKQGIHPKIVSEALGHSSVAFTLDVYSHIISGVQKEALMRLSDVIPPAIGSNKINTNLTPTIDIRPGNN